MDKVTERVFRSMVEKALSGEIMGEVEPNDDNVLFAYFATGPQLEDRYLVEIKKIS